MIEVLYPCRSNSCALIRIDVVKSPRVSSASCNGDDCIILLNAPIILARLRSLVDLALLIKIYLVTMCYFGNLYIILHHLFTQTNVKPSIHPEICKLFIVSHSTEFYLLFHVCLKP